MLLVFCRLLTERELQRKGGGRGGRAGAVVFVRAEINRHPVFSNNDKEKENITNARTSNKDPFPSSSNPSEYRPTSRFEARIACKRTPPWGGHCEGSAPPTLLLPCLCSSPPPVHFSFAPSFAAGSVEGALHRVRRFRKEKTFNDLFFSKTHDLSFWVEI